MLAAVTFNCYKDDHLYLPSNGTTILNLSSIQQCHDSGGTMTAENHSVQASFQVNLSWQQQQLQTHEVLWPTVCEACSNIAPWLQSSEAAAHIGGHEECK